MSEPSAGSDTSHETDPSLKKELGLWDVYTVSTGAMFSSGFFLLPGLATAYGGPSTVFAYLVAGLLMIPAMLSIAELTTALPRAGGAYYFLDRSLGPGMGTVGGLGTWLVLVLKSGFALLGMGAYLAIMPGFSDWLPGGNGQQLWVIKGLAVALTVIFAAINVIGAKETMRLQSAMVVALLAVLAFFLIQGLWYVFFRLPPEQVRGQFTPLVTERYGIEGVVTTIGMVFVSYAGLTKVASVSEEVRRPERNLPLGMFLSLATATAIYVVGVAIMIAVLDPEVLRSDYTPVATAATEFFDWLPAPLGLVLIIAAALAAFASTGNAGILAASRYPLAMARDDLISRRFGRLSRFGTPVAGILATAGMMIFFIVILSAEGVAKVASAFNLFVFGLMNVVVVVMRESRIESYDPGFRSPWYPWTQFLGVLISIVLIVEMGWLALVASLSLAGLSVGWYWYYARDRVVREGAIYHIFARLGYRRFEELEEEFREIIKEKGLREEDPFDDVVTRAAVIDAREVSNYEELVAQVAERVARRTSLDAATIGERFLESGHHGSTPLSRGALLPHFRAAELERSELVIVRCCPELVVDVERFQAETQHDAAAEEAAEESDRLQRRQREQAKRREAMPSEIRVKAAFFLVSPESDSGLHLRILAQIASRLERDDFLDRWYAAEGEQAMKEELLRDERFIRLGLDASGPASELVGRRVEGLGFPDDTLVALVRRGSRTFVPRERTRLAPGDRLTVVGAPAGIAELYARFKPGQDPAEPEAPADGHDGETPGC